MTSAVTASRVAFEARTALPFERAVERCREELGREGFGVLTEIDVQATLKKKLDVDVAPYLILGACHPPSAHRALATAPEVGVLLPCNVTVSVEGGSTVVRAMRPDSVAQVLDQPALEPLMAEVGAALARVVGRVADG
jgi:uncharacterized protein (DUF302 family)